MADSNAPSCGDIKMEGKSSYKLGMLLMESEADNTQKRPQKHIFLVDFYSMNFQYSS